MNFSSLRDLAKVGVLLIGVALLILALIALHLYIAFYGRIQPPYPERPLSAYCSHGAVIISANEELEDVKVLDNRSRIICIFDKIPRGSKELCLTGGQGFYVVQWRDFKDVVGCWHEVERMRPAWD